MHRTAMDDEARTAPCQLCGEGLPSLLASPRWRIVRFADPCPLAGWMMLVSRAHRAGPWELDDVEAAEFGAVVGGLSRAVRAATGCERTYLLSFNEAVPHMNLHVVPRHAGDAGTAGWAVADHARAVLGRTRPAVSAEEADALAARVVALAEPALAAVGFVRGA